MAYKEKHKIRTFSLMEDEFLNECQITGRVPNHDYLETWAQYIRDNYKVGAVYIVIHTGSDGVDSVRLLEADNVNNHQNFVPINNNIWALKISLYDQNLSF